MLRRSDLRGCVVVLLSCACVGPSPVPEEAQVRRLATGLGFTEGPVWLPEREILVFSDIPNDKLMQWSEAGGLSVFRESEGSNGNSLDLDGRLLTCQHDARNIVRTEADGSLTVLVDRFAGRRLNSPNDMAVHSDGAVWFTDPPWGLENLTEGKELEGHWVFRFDPTSGELRTVKRDAAMPNGIALSPDESVLYLADTGRFPRDRVSQFQHVEPTLTAYAVLDGERLAGTPLWKVNTLCDGLAVDERGNIYATGHEGVTVWSPDGEPLGAIPVPEQPANACFGGPDGKTLFITARTSLYAIELDVAGAKPAGARW